MDDEKLFARILVIVGLFIAGLTLVFGVMHWVSGYTRLTSAENVIHNYEWFFDVKNAVDARVAQVKSHREVVAAERDEAELRRLRIELGGMQQSCRDLVADYNSNAQKATRAIFQSNNLPQYLDAAVCE